MSGRLRVAGSSLARGAAWTGYKRKGLLYVSESAKRRPHSCCWGAHGVLELGRQTQTHKQTKESSTDFACTLTAILSLPLLPSVTTLVNRPLCAWC